jgi:hypothetical protein
MRFKTIISLLLSSALALGEVMITEDGVVRIYNHPEDANNVKVIIETFREYGSGIKSRLGLNTDRQLKIYIANSGAEFGQLTGWKLPLWAQGVAFPEENTIVLKSPRWSGSSFDLGRAAAHEYVHILINRGSEKVPLWLNEGLAVLLSGESYFDSRLISLSSLSGRFLTFDEMEEVLKFNHLKAGLAYQQSLSATQYLVSQFGWEAVRNIFKGLEAGEDFETAFMKSTGLWVNEFEAEWIEKRGKNLRLSFLKDLQYYLGFILVPLFIIIAGLLWWKRRKIKREWEEEEKLQDISDYYFDG